MSHGAVSRVYPDRVVAKQGGGEGVRSVFGCCDVVVESVAVGAGVDQGVAARAARTSARPSSRTALAPPAYAARAVAATPAESSQQALPPTRWYATIRAPSSASKSV